MADEIPLDFVDFDEFEVDFSNLSLSPTSGEQTFRPQEDNTEWNEEPSMEENRDTDRTC